jgi:hypothetical protein
MVLSTGQKYRCQDLRCGAEILVLKGATPKASKALPTCACGAALLQGWARPTYIPSLLRGTSLRPR